MDLVYPNEQRLFRIALVLAAIVWAIILIGTLGIALFYIGLFFLFAIFAHSGFITHLKGNGVKITASQYPDLHERVEACCKKMGLKEVPEAYLLRTDFFNALATRFLRRHYIVLFTDVVDALIAKPGAVNFYIGHEIGHIHRRHIRWGWVLAPVLWLPVLGSAYRRAEEYTCDRYGSACCDSDEDAVAAMSAIVAGDTRWHDFKVDSYLEQVNETGGFFMSLNELISDYPWLCKRLAWVKALRAGTTPDLPRRNVFAGILSVFVPSVPGGAGTLIVMIAIIGILAAVALPAYQDYVASAEQAQEQAAAPIEPSEEPLAQPEPLASTVDVPTPEDLSLLLDEISVIRDDVDAFYLASQALPGDLTEMNWDYSVVYTERDELPVAVYEGGVIAITLGSNDDGEVYLINEPLASEAGELEWYCYGQNIDPSALPQQCQ